MTTSNTPKPECRCGKEFRPLGHTHPNCLRCIVCGRVLATMLAKAVA